MRVQIIGARNEFLLMQFHIEVKLFWFIFEQPIMEILLKFWEDMQAEH